MNIVLAGERLSVSSGRLEMGWANTFARELTKNIRTTERFSVAPSRLES